LLPPPQRCSEITIDILNRSALEYSLLQLPASITVQLQLDLLQGLGSLNRPHNCSELAVLINYL